MQVALIVSAFEAVDPGFYCRNDTMEHLHPGVLGPSYAVTDSNAKAWTHCI